MFMKKEHFEALMREQNKNLQKQGVQLKIPVCPECGTKLKNSMDTITKKISKYLWESDCGCESMKNFRLSRG